MFQTDLRVLDVIIAIAGRAHIVGHRFQDKSGFPFTWSAAQIPPMRPSMLGVPSVGLDETLNEMLRHAETC